METQIRRHGTVQTQEYMCALKGRAAQPTKKVGPSMRGALGDLSNVLHHVNTGKVSAAKAEFEKKASHIVDKGALKSNYSHVQSRVDTRRATKPALPAQPASRPPLRRQESTAALAGRAAVTHQKVIQKENKPKDYISIIKKETKKTTKVPAAKAEKEKSLKPILKESTESMGKLKLGDNTTSLINLAKLETQALVLKPEPIEDLPEDVEDIDAEDVMNPFLTTEYIKDIYRYLTELEEKYPIKPDFLEKHAVVTGKMRATLVDWLVEVQNQFSLMLETFHLTVGIIDRYLQVVPEVQRNEIQLIGVTAMFLASKYEEIYPPDIADFIYVTDKAYSKAEMFRCEREIMSKLQFSLARPIPLSFLRRFIKVARGTSKNHHLAKYFVDLCLVEYSMAHYRPSELAAAAICLSLHLLSSKEMDQIWTRTLVYYSGYELQHIEPIICKIAKVVLNVEKSSRRAVYQKYQSNSLAKVSNVPQLKSEIIYKLAGMPIND